MKLTAQISRSPAAEHQPSIGNHDSSARCVLPTQEVTGALRSKERSLATISLFQLKAFLYCMQSAQGRSLNRMSFSEGVKVRWMSGFGRKSSQLISPPGDTNFSEKIKYRTLATKIGAFISLPPLLPQKPTGIKEAKTSPFEFVRFMGRRQSQLVS